MNRITFDSPVGRIEIVEENEKIIRIDFSKDEKSEKRTTPLLEKAKEELLEYFFGNRMTFDFPYELSGTDFQKAVWHELEKIPFGETRTYGEIASAIGKPKASRAVGGACNKNKIIIAVPCHRVIGKGGKLVGFAFGTDKKEWLLSHEAGSKGEDNEN